MISPVLRGDSSNLGRRLRADICRWRELGGIGSKSGIDEIEATNQSATTSMMLLAPKGSQGVKQPKFYF